MFISPMLASPLPKKSLDLASGYWAEEKIDGIRLVVEVGDCVKQALFEETRQVTPWSRYGKVHPIPDHIEQILLQFPDCILDGELFVIGKRSYGATELVNRDDLIYCVFDILQLGTVDCTKHIYTDRREVLADMFSRINQDKPSVIFATSTPVHTQAEIDALVKAVWARDGEGLILKLDTPYRIGKRPKDWIKIKKLQTAVLTITGFEPSKGTIQNRGNYATVVLVDSEGHQTTVKTRNDAECAGFELRANNRVPTEHPDIGRKLRIEFQERTPDGNYRHPRWDRWEDE